MSVFFISLTMIGFSMNNQERWEEAKRIQAKHVKKIKHDYGVDLGMSPEDKVDAHFDKLRKLYEDDQNDGIQEWHIISIGVAAIVIFSLIALAIRYL